MENLRSTARTNEVNGTAIRILKLYAEDTAAKGDTYLKSIITSLSALSAQMTEAIKMGRAASDLDEADIARDAAVRSLFTAVEGYSVMKSATLREPAQRLLLILERYGTKMTRENYTSESSLIEALLTDLAATQPVADMAELAGIADAAADIRTAEDAFRDKQTAYEKATAVEKNTVSPTKLKPQLITLINDDLVLHLRAKKKSDAEAYGALADAVSQAIADTNSAIKQRTGKKEVKGETK